MSEDIDINIQYEQIFGHEERPNIFKPDDEEYIALRQEILASKREIVKTNELPFSGINIIPYDEYVRNRVIQLMESKGYHIFYLKVYRNANLDIYAAGYYDESDCKFVVLQDSFCNDSDYFNELARKQKKIYGKPSRSIFDAYTRAIAFINSFAIKGSKLQQIKAVRYDSASLAASYYLGYKTTFRAWKDANGKSLDNFYHKYRSSKIDVSEDSTFPGYIKPEVKYAIGDIISTLSNMVGKHVVKRNRFGAISEIKKVEKTADDVLDEQHNFYIKRNAKLTRTCLAIGNYDTENGKFTLQAGSLIALIATPSYDMSSARTSRARFIAHYCVKEQNGYRLKKDYEFDTPSAAASYVLGSSANGWLDWIDEDGNTLDSVFRKKK